MTLNKRIALVDNFNQEIGIAALEQAYADVYAIKIKKTEKELSLNKWRSAFETLLQEAHQLNAAKINFRLIKEIGLDDLAAVLFELGFVKKNERVEYKLLVDQLPKQDSAFRLNWKTAEALNWSTQQIANALRAVTENDPAYDPLESPEDYIQDFIHHEELTHGLSCIHFGFLNDVMIAMTVVQCDFNEGINNGWSRISYMGVRKEFRNQGYGKEVHLYSFQIMKDCGGKLYHGGTSALNTPMIRLFEKHNCQLFKKMEEWTYTMKGYDNETN